EFTVIAEGSFHRRVRPETFVPVVVVLVGLPAIPAGAAFDPKMIIAFPGQPAVSVARFQNTLRQGYAGRNAGALHFLHRQAAVNPDVVFGIQRALRAYRRGRLLPGTFPAGFGRSPAVGYPGGCRLLSGSACAQEQGKDN